MNHKPSNGEISHIKSHLLAALNGVAINRYHYDEKGQRSGIAQTIRVPLKYGHKTRQIHEAIQINGNIVLPIMAVTMSGVSIDNERNEAKKQRVYDFEYTGADGIKRYVKPTPVNLNFNVSIVTTKGSDMEEIIAHYLSVFNPYIYISWKHPFSNKELRSKVMWDGNLSTSYPTDTDSASKIRYICDLGFTVESWIFREQAHSMGVIKEIKYTLNIEQGLDCYYDSSDGYVFQDEGSIKGQPSIIGITPTCAEVGDYIIVDGLNLDHVDGVFFQGANGSNIPVSSWDPFLFSDLSATVPPFDAYVLDEWSSVDANRMVIKIPQELSASQLDLGLINRFCGISMASDTLSGCHEPYITVS